MEFDFQLILVVAFLIIGAIRWVIQNLSGTQQGPPEKEHWEDYDYEERADHTSNPVPRNPETHRLEDLYEEARREILSRQNSNTPDSEVVREKLSTSRPPARAQERTPPPLPNKPAPAAPISLTPKAPPYQLPEVQRTQLTSAERKALEALENRAEENPFNLPQPQPKSQSQSRVRDLLSSPQAARDAIVLTEILGKPKGA